MYLVVLIIKQAVPYSGRLAQQVLSLTEMRGQMRHLLVPISKHRVSVNALETTNSDSVESCCAQGFHESHVSNNSVISGY